MRRAWLLAAACANPGNSPPVTPLVVIAAPGMSAEPGMTVNLYPTPPIGAGSQYTLAYDDATKMNVPLPTSVKFAGNEVLAAQLNASACSDPIAGVGVEATHIVFATASAFGTPMSPDQDLSVVIGGPLVGQMRGSWTVPYLEADMTTMHTASGVSTFTVFPNGRIVRHDESLQVTTMNDTLSDNLNCGCGPVATSDFESFYALGPGSDQGSDSPFRHCLVQTDATVGVAFGGDANGSVKTLTYSAVWQSAAPSKLALQDHTTAIFVADKGADCGAVIAALDDVGLNVGPGEDVFTNADGIYLDDNPHRTAYDIAAMDPSKPVPPFAMFTSVDHAVITQAGKDAGFVLAQDLEDDPSRILLYFRDGLAAGESIHVEPQ